MKNLKFIIIVLFVILSSVVYVVKAEEVENIIIQYDKLGYELAPQTINRFKKEKTIELYLPTKFPFVVTHMFGKIDNEGKLGLYYLNQSTKEYMKVFVSTDINYISTSGEITKLNNSITAYINDKHPNGISMSFVYKNLSYIYYFSHLNQTNELTDNDLVEIANSIQKDESH